MAANEDERFSRYLVPPPAPKTYVRETRVRVVRTFEPNHKLLKEIRRKNKNISDISKQRQFYGSVPKNEIAARKKVMQDLADRMYYRNYNW